MKLHITGVSHKTAPVEVRERLAFRPETLPAALADLKSREGVTEAVIVSTCNRVEITVTTDDQSDPQAIVHSFLAERKNVSPESIAPHLYRHDGRDATEKRALRVRFARQPGGLSLRCDFARRAAQHGRSERRDDHAA